jgi:hypothetical protein
MSPTLILCAGPCNRMTRVSKVKIADAPGTVCRVRDGKCKACLSGNTRDLSVTDTGARSYGLLPCTGVCGQLTRSNRMPRDRYPYRVRTKDGMCSSCRRKLDPEWRQLKIDQERLRREAQNFAKDQAATALNAWLASRRNRTPQRRAA